MTVSRSGNHHHDWKVKNSSSCCPADTPPLCVHRCKANVTCVLFSGVMTMTIPDCSFSFKCSLGNSSLFLPSCAVTVMNDYGDDDVVFSSIFPVLYLHLHPQPSTLLCPCTDWHLFTMSCCFAYLVLFIRCFCSHFSLTHCPFLLKVCVQFFLVWGHVPFLTKLPPPCSQTPPVLEKVVICCCCDWSLGQRMELWSLSSLHLRFPCMVCSHSLRVVTTCSAARFWLSSPALWQHSACRNASSYCRLFFPFLSCREEKKEEL